MEFAWLEAPLANQDCPHGPADPQGPAATQNSRLFFSMRRPPEPGEPASALVDLIQGLWQRFGTDARRYVRRPIWTTCRLTEREYGMARVAAKRVRQLPALTLSRPPRLASHPDPCPNRPQGLIRPESWIRVTPAPCASAPASALDRAIELASALGEDPQRWPNRHWSDADALALARALARTCVRRDLRALSARPIGAVLTDADGVLLSWGVNDNGLDRTAHAEIRCLQSWWANSRRPLPRGARLYTTLKPCKMCAGFIWESAEDPMSLEVIAAETDPGRLAKETVLTPGSNERRRAMGTGTGGSPQGLWQQVERIHDEKGAGEGHARI